MRGGEGLTISSVVKTKVGIHRALFIRALGPDGPPDGWILQIRGFCHRREEWARSSLSDVILVKTSKLIVEVPTVNFVTDTLGGDTFFHLASHAGAGFDDRQALGLEILDPGVVFGLVDYGVV